MTRTSLFSGIAVLLVAALPAFADPPTQTIHVNCDAGGRLGPALASRAALLNIRFRGTCTERLTIARDDVSLTGAEAGATIVGSVVVRGGSRVRLTRFTVRDTPGDDPFSSEGDAVQILASQNVRVERVRAQDPGRRGFNIEESAVDLIDVTVLRADGAGIQLQSSGVNVFGTLTITDGEEPGLLMANLGHAFLRRNARMVLDRNAIGLVVQANATLTLSNESRLQANDNLFLGILITSQGDMLYGEVRIEARGNGLGVLVSELSNWTPFVGSPATVEITGNAAGGVLLERGGFLELGDGTATVTGNGGPGLYADDSRIILRGTTAQGNPGGDVVLLARTSAIFNDGNTFGTPVACDGTVLVRGTVACGAGLPAAAGARTADGPRPGDIVRQARALLGRS